MSKQEIEEFLKGKGDFVRMDHLSRFLDEKSLPIDKKKFVYQKLIEIYEQKGMFGDVAKMYRNIALISVAFSEKIKNHVKEAEFYVKAGFFEDADAAIKKSMGEANASQKAEISFVIKEFYKKQAEVYEKERRRANASKIYEKLLQMKISEGEREEIKKKLMDLYEKLGRIKEYFILKEGKFDRKV